MQHMFLFHKLLDPKTLSSHFAVSSRKLDNIAKIFLILFKHGLTVAPNRDDFFHIHAGERLGLTMREPRLILFIYVVFFL